jgi:hypothetical protein
VHSCRNTRSNAPTGIFCACAFIGTTQYAHSHLCLTHKGSNGISKTALRWSLLNPVCQISRPRIWCLNVVRKARRRNRRARSEHFGLLGGDAGNVRSRKREGARNKNRQTSRAEKHSPTSKRIQPLGPLGPRCFAPLLNAIRNLRPTTNKEYTRGNLNRDT